MNQSFQSQIDSQLARWENDKSNDGGWDARRLVNDLSKAGHHELAVQHGSRALEIWSDLEPLSSALSWALYRKDLAAVTEESDLQQRRIAKHAVDRIKQLCSGDPYGTYSPWPSASLKFSSVLAKRWPNAALDLLSQLDPVKLSEKSDQKFPSDRERWFMLTTKALASGEQWEELLRTCDTARNEQCIDATNQKWLRLRRADALRHLGNTGEAERIIGDEAKSAGDWWLYARWAKILVELGQEEAALDAAYCALLAGGASSFGWETLALVGDLLQDKEPQLASDHARLSRLFRQKEGWPQNAPLEELAKRLGIKEEDGAIISELCSRLKKTWLKVEDAQRETGVVIKHINDGAGFIEPDSSGGSLFFSLPKDAKKNLPQIGVRVSFIRQKSFDKSKNRESERAAKWLPVND